MRMKRDEAAEKLAEELKIIREEQKTNPESAKEMGGLFSMEESEQKLTRDYVENIINACVSYQPAKQLFGEHAALTCLCMALITSLFRNDFDESDASRAMRSQMRKTLIKHLRKMEGDDGT